jgi:hypothetical protein
MRVQKFENANGLNFMAVSIHGQVENEKSKMKSKK